MLDGPLYRGRFYCRDKNSKVIRLFILLEADLDNKFTLITNEYMDGYNARHDCHISLVTLLPDLIGLFRGQKVKRILVRKQYL